MVGSLVSVFCSSIFRSIASSVRFCASRLFTILSTFQYQSINPLITRKTTNAIRNVIIIPTRLPIPVSDCANAMKGTSPNSVNAFFIMIWFKLINQIYDFLANQLNRPADVSAEEVVLGVDHDGADVDVWEFAAKVVGAVVFAE